MTSFHYISRLFTECSVYIQGTYRWEQDKVFNRPQDMTVLEIDQSGLNPLIKPMISRY